MSLKHVPLTLKSAACLAALAAALSAQMPRAGTLKINSEPAGARIFINGKLVPRAVTNTSIVVSPGTYTVTIDRPANSPPALHCEQKVTVQAGQSTTVQCPKQ